MCWGPAYLLVETLNPAPQILQLLGGEIIAGIQGSVEVLSQHILVEGLACEAACGIAAGEVLVRTARPVEVAPGSHVVDFAAHGQVHGRRVFAIVLEQGARCVSLKDDGRGTFGERGRCRGSQAEVEQGQEREEEGEVQRRGQCVARGIAKQLSVRWFSMGRRKREEGEGGGRPAIDTSTRAGSALSNGIFGLVASLETENN